MNALALSLAYLRRRPLTTALNLALLAIGVGTIALLLLFADQLRSTLERDARGIDMVVGAKGSPMQLILSSVFHVDIPTGNIRLGDARELAVNPMVRAVFPLGLGDTFRGWRIVGAEHAFVELFDAELAQGALWQAPLEATAGALAAEAAGLEVGAQFVGSHGMAGGGAAHEETPFRVVGVLRKTGTVLDRLILTSMESVWAVHEPHAPADAPGESGHDDHENEQDTAAVPGAGGLLLPHDDADREITALLVQFRNPIAAAILPRLVNMNTPMQAALPGFELARLMRMIGLGIDGFRAFAWVLVVSAGLGIFAALSQALAQRRYDIAVMRALGAARGAILRQILLEGALLAGAGAVLGLVLGHAAAEIAGGWLWREYQTPLEGLAWAEGEIWLLPGALALGIAAAIIPAWHGFRMDISAVLARG